MQSSLTEAADTEKKPDDLFTAESLESGRRQGDKLRALLAVCGALLIFAAGLGAAQQSYGVWLAHYKEHEYQDISYSLLSLAGSVCPAFCDAVGIFVGVAVHLLGTTATLLISSLLTTTAYLALSWVRPFWAVVLVQGLWLGFATSAFLVTPAWVVSAYFSRRRSLVMAIIDVGQNVGALLTPVLFHAFEPHGLRATDRYFAATLGAALFLGSLLCRPRRVVQQDKVSLRHAVPQPSILRDQPLLFACLAKGFGWFAIWGFTYYIPSLAAASCSPNLAPFIFTVYSSSGIPGRLIGGALADRFGVISAYFASSAICTVILAATCMTVSDNATAIVCAVLLGLSIGAWQSIGNAVVPRITDLRRSDRLAAMSWAVFFSIPGLGSAPLGGTIIRDGSSKPYFWLGLLYSGFFAIASVGSGLVRLWMQDSGKVTQEAEMDVN